MLGLGAAGCITAATNLTCRFAQIVYSQRTGPEADAAMMPCRGRVCLTESLEDERQELGLDSDAGIRDLKS